jgi:solute carrier family 38 (sodium-coupled neutral amino acid transporter), member 2
MPSQSSRNAGMETPLLQQDGNDTLESPPSPLPTSQRRDCSFKGGVANLVVTAVGAGMLAMPKAFSTVGIALGICIAVLAGGLTILSASVIVTHAARSGKDSYSSLVRSAYGPRGAAILSSSIIIHVFGVMVVYLMIICDQLVGSAPDYQGLLPTLFLKHHALLPWYFTRTAVSGALVLCVVMPLLLSRSLSFLSRFSRASVKLLLAIAATLLALAATALVKGNAAKDVYILPDIDGMGGIGPFISALLAVLAVSALAFTLHFNLVPIHRSLRQAETSVMLHATRCAVVIAGTLYIAVALAGYVLFGSRTDGDVLKNLTINRMSTVIPPRVATVVLTCLIVATTANLLVNFVLKVWAVREAGCELLMHRPASDLHHGAYYTATTVIVIMAWSLSIVTPSVWFLVSLVGSTACVTFAYAFPGLLLIRKATSRLESATGYGGVFLATIMAATAIYNAITGASGL